MQLVEYRAYVFRLEGLSALGGGALEGWRGWRVGGLEVDFQTQQFSTTLQCPIPTQGALWT